MVVCSSEHQDVPEERLDEMPLSRRKEMAKKYIWNHGIAPPLKNVRKRRYRKTAPKKVIVMIILLLIIICIGGPHYNGRPLPCNRMLSL
jgi:hypothetical protein